PAAAGGRADGCRGCGRHATAGGAGGAAQDDRASRAPGVTPRAACARRDPELARRGAQAPDWTESEWRVARAVVAIHGVSGLLAGALRWQGPAGWRVFLGEKSAQVAQRLPRIQALRLRRDFQ